MIIMITGTKKTETSISTTKKKKEKLKTRHKLLISCLCNHLLNFQMSSHIPPLFYCTITVSLTIGIVNIQYCIIFKIKL